jgi:hypothetical protein
MAPANIYYDNTSLERLLEKSRQDFPIAGVAIKLEGDSSETQADRAHEIIRIVLDPQQFASLLGIAKVRCASGIAEVEGKPGELITEDLYEWIRRFLKRLVEDFIRDPIHVRYREGIQGIRLDITSSNDAELKCRFHLGLL